MVTAPAMSWERPLVLVIERSADGPRVSVSVALLLARFGSGPFVPSSSTVAVLTMVAPAGAATTSTAKLSGIGIAETGTTPSAIVHSVPAADPFGHDQPAVLEAALNVVSAGTVSVTITLAAAWLPTLVTPSA